MTISYRQKYRHASSMDRCPWLVGRRNGPRGKEVSREWGNYFFFHYYITSSGALGGVVLFQLWSYLSVLSSVKVNCCLRRSEPPSSWENCYQLATRERVSGKFSGCSALSSSLCSVCERDQKLDKYYDFFLIWIGRQVVNGVAWAKEDTRSVCW